MQQELFGLPSPERQDDPGPAPSSDALVGSYVRRDVRVDVHRDGTELAATITRTGAVGSIFGDDPAVRLMPTGGTRFTSVRADGGGTDVWDFIGLDRDGVPATLMTERVHRRVP